MKSLYYSFLQPKVYSSLIRRYVSSKPEHIIPDYMKQVYSFWYLNPKNVPRLDREVIVNTLLWGHAEKLEGVVVDSIRPGNRVLQGGATYGNLTTKAAVAVGKEGFFDVLDITPIQVDLHRNKLKDFPQARVRLGDVVDAHIPHEPSYDFAYTFMLLHELPDDKKRKAVDGILSSTKPDGVAMFIDYHRPSFFPLRLYLLAIFQIFEPFGFLMMKRDIQSFASPDLEGNFEWKKTTVFSDMFQVVTARRIK